MARSDGVQIRDYVVLFIVRQHVCIGRHSVAAGIDHGTHVLVRHLLAILQLFALEQALERRADLLLISVHVVANRALLKDLFALSGVPFLLGRRERRESKDHYRTDRRNDEFSHVWFGSSATTQTTSLQSWDAARHRTSSPMNET